MHLHWYYLVLLILLGLVVLVQIVGRSLPRGHTAICTIILRTPPDQVWAAITDWRNLRSWRQELTAVEEYRSPDGKSGWAETSSFGRIPMTAERDEHRRILVTLIADPKLPFGGGWTTRVEPADGGSKVSITEDGFVKTPLFRVMARFVFGYHKTMNGYLRSLAKKFGETAVPKNS